MPVRRGPLKIGYLLDRFPAPSEAFVANELRALAAEGADVTVFALHGHGPGPVPGMPVLRPADLTDPPAITDVALACRMASEAIAMERGAARELAAALRWTGWAARVAAAVRRRGIRHLHAHFASLPAALALMVATAAPVSVSFSAHARDVYCGGRSLARKLARARLCIACSDVAARHIRRCARRADRNKVVRIYHGTDLELFAYRPPPEPSDCPHLLAVGRLVPKKGFTTLLRACAMLKEERRFRCTIVGSGPRARRLKAFARWLGLRRMVSFPGWVPYRSMPALYAGADVVVVPSRRTLGCDRDGLPNVVVEAMACGVPVVGSDFAGIPEAIEHERTGLLCPPGEPEDLAASIERMLSDLELRRSVAENARRLAEEQFDFRRNGRLVLQAIARAAE